MIVELDLTDFGSAAKFERFLRRHGLSSGYKRVLKRRKKLFEPGYYERFEYTWSNSKVKLSMNNNPLTGEWTVPSDRENEKGYASHVGVEGDPASVRKVVADIRRTAWVKE